MSDQHPNPKNKIPGKNAQGRNIHNTRKRKHGDACRAASAGERHWNENEDPPNRAGKVARREAQRSKIKEAE